MQDLVLPKSMGRAIEDQFGPDGTAWLTRHQKVLRELMTGWDLQLESFVDAGLPINAVCFVRQGDRHLVLKTGYPEPELYTEIEVLRLWQGRPGCVQLIDVDEENGVMLMERVIPGTPFRSEPASTRSSNIPPLFAGIPMDVSIASLPTYEDWLSRAFARHRESEGKQLVDYLGHAESLYRNLSRAYSRNWLLHGDLHHENMLRDENGRWVAIDPKGVLGPRVMEYGRFMHNFMADEVSESESVETILMKRANTLSGEFSARELLAAGFVDLVVSVCWTVNSGGEMTESHQELLGNYNRLV